MYRITMKLYRFITRADDVIYSAEIYMYHKGDNIYREGWGSGNPLDRHFGDAHFEFYPRYRLTEMTIFVAFLSPP
jgi:hypothetical protein